MAELVWLLLDANHDGELTLEELEQWAAIATNFGLIPLHKATSFQQAWTNPGSWSRASATHYFKAADLNKDGTS